VSGEFFGLPPPPMISVSRKKRREEEGTTLTVPCRHLFEEVMFPLLRDEVPFPLFLARPEEVFR